MLTLAILICLLPWTGAAPAEAEPRVVDVDVAGNMTVCPYETAVDDNPRRVPRRIKIIRCAGGGGGAGAGAGAGAGGGEAGCAHGRHGARRRCVELHDSVLVWDRAAKRAELLEVPVGCACMLTRARPAQALLDARPGT